MLYVIQYLFSMTKFKFNIFKKYFHTRNRVLYFNFNRKPHGNEHIYIYINYNYNKTYKLKNVPLTLNFHHYSYCISIYKLIL